MYICVCVRVCVCVCVCMYVCMYETALVRVKHYIMMSIDQGKTVILALLDLSVSFDTFDHNVLFSRLKYMFGLSGRVLEWFRSYLEQRSILFAQRLRMAPASEGALLNIHYYYMIDN